MSAPLLKWTPAAFGLVATLASLAMILALAHIKLWKVDTPKSDRWNARAVPSLGGVGIYLGTFLALALTSPQVLLGPLWICASLMFFAGLADDLWNLLPYQKLASQILISCLLLFLAPLYHDTIPTFLIFPLALLWLLAITNGMNLLDNMDGLAGGIALISATFLSITGMIYVDNTSALGILLALGGASLGFLILNHNPAKVFMGDCGSQFLGFTLAAASIYIRGTGAKNLLFVVLIPMAVLIVPVFDTIIVTITRRLKGTSIAQGGKDHTSHRLVSLGLSERQSVYLLWGISILFGLVGCTFLFFTWPIALIVTSGALACLVALGNLLANRPNQEDEYPPLPRHRSLKLFKNQFSYRRHWVELLMDSLLICASYVLAYIVRYEGNLDAFLHTQMTQTLPLVLGIKVAALMSTGLYKGLWTYVDIDHVKILVLRVAFASLLTIAFILGRERFLGYSRSLFFLDFLLLLTSMLGFRVLLRVVRESVFAFPKAGIPVVILGSGQTSKNLLHSIRAHRHWGLLPLAVFDMDLAKHGARLVQILIKGGESELNDFLKQNDVSAIIAAFDNPTRPENVRLIGTAQAHGIPVYATPNIEAMLVRPIVQNHGAKSDDVSPKSDSCTG